VGPNDILLFSIKNYFGKFNEINGKPTGNTKIYIIMIFEYLIRFEVTLNNSPILCIMLINYQLSDRSNPSLLYDKRPYPGADPGFQVKGGALKKIAPSRGRREKCWGISCEKSRFYVKKSYFFQF
jgi:hypothetical protein